jgi:phosphatidylinositol 3-kinase
MKLCKEMVDLLGGTSSPHFASFKSYSFIAFNSLRKQANLIINLFALMQLANIPDISIEPEKLLLKIEERFRLDLTDEESIQFLNEVLSVLNIFR